MTFKSKDYNRLKHDWIKLKRWPLRLAVTLLKEDYPIYENGIVSGTWSNSHQAIYKIAQDSIDLGGLKQLKDKKSKQIGECVDPTQFVKWAESRDYDIPESLSILLKKEGELTQLVNDKNKQEPLDKTENKALILKKSNNNHTDQVNPKTSVDTNGLNNALPPRTITGIAKLFPINTKDEKNIKKWKLIASYATKPGYEGVLKARTKKSAGRGQSLFDPILIGDWVVEKAYFKRDEVNRKLSSNIEPGYEEYKDYF